MREETEADAGVEALIAEGERLFNAGEVFDALGRFERASVCAPRSATVHCNLGAANWALGRTHEAVSCFQRARECAPDHSEAALNLARALAAMGRRDEAAAVAREFLARRPDADAFREFIGGAEEPKYPAVPVADSGRLRVAVFSREPDWACTRLRLWVPLGALSERMDLIRAYRIANGKVWFDVDRIDACDVIVVQRLFPGPETAAICRRIFSSGRPVIYELDDDFLDVPETHPFYDVIKAHQPFVREMLGLANAVTVTSMDLAERLRAYNPAVYVLPNALEADLWGRWSPVQKGAAEPVVIGFAGTATHQADLTLVSEALRRIRAKHGDRVALRFLGCAPPGLEGEWAAEPFDWSYDDYAEKLAHSGIDIAIAPLVDDPFNRCKSDIKWLEYSACGFAGVYSDLPAYRNSVRDGETGLLVANTTEAWFEALDRLVGDSRLRQRIGHAARAAVLSTRTVQTIAPRYFELYSELARTGRRRAGRDWKPVSNYEEWWQRQCRFRGGCQWKAARRVVASFHLMVLAPAGAPAGLSDTLESIAGQEYPPARVMVVGQTPDGDLPSCRGLEIEWVEAAGAWPAAVNRLIRESSAEWVGLVDAGCLLERDTLSRCAEFAAGHPDCRLLYTDEDRIGAAGGYYQPQFKPDFNLELLRAMPYVGRCIFVHREQLPAIGAMSMDGAAHYDLVLRIAERAGPSAVGHVPWVLVHRQDGLVSGDAAEGFPDAHRRVLEAHLRRVGIDARVREGTLAGTFFVDYAVPAGSPRVDIVVDGDVSQEMLSLTLTHVLQKTEYPAFRVVVAVPEGAARVCEAKPDGRVRYISYRARDGLEAAIEVWVAETDAPYLLFLRAGVLPLRGHWLHRLLGPMQRPDVMVTAPRLVSADTSVVDGGIILGGGAGVGAVAHAGLTADAPGYMGRAQVAQELGAVTDNCLLIRTAALRAAGGFPESIDTPLYRSVDLCRRVAAGGGVIVWTPHATLLYVEAAVGETDRPERERTAEQEAPAVCRRWLPELARDPAYNPNLSLRAADFRVVEDLPSPAVFDSSRLRILGFGATTFGSWKYRVDQPLEALHREGLAHRFLIDFAENGIARLPTVAELERLEVDALLFHNAVHDYALDALRLYRRVNQAFVVLGEDDLMTTLPPKNPYSETVYKDIRRRIRRACELADRVVVTTEPLAEALRRYSGDVRVVPNGLPTEIWGSLPRARRRGGRPRVGWAGASQHQGDLELLREVVEATAAEVEWVFFGMCPDFLRPYAQEIHDGVPFDAYPAKLASLELDLAVAPLELNDFNRCKSNLRLLEYGALGWPVVASDIEPYRDAPVCRVRNQARAWVQAIRERIHEPEAAQREGDALREWVLAYGMLEGQLADWSGVLSVQTGVRGGAAAGKADRPRQGAG
ncbi:glycosyl transferases group 1 [bacterium BMS3Abin12]|nr:glycosyl transferases group 1 [bacterium BMS3Abin12]